MKIKIIATEKKLTLSLLKQMPGLPYRLFDQVEVLGYITAGKVGSKRALCVLHSEYYLLDLLFERRGSYAGYNGNFRGERILRLEPEIIDDWFQKYDEIKKKANRAGHIYI